MRVGCVVPMGEIERGSVFVYERERERERERVEIECGGGAIKIVFAC